MNAIRRHLLFTVWIACCLGLIAAGMGWFLHLRKNVARELVAVEKKTQQRAQWAQEIRQAEPVLIGFPAEQPAIAPVVLTGEKTIPRKPLDGFIEIAGVVEKLRRLASEQNVSLHPDEFFGFASYAHQGPKANELVAVHEQIGLTQLLVEKLLVAQPGALLAVRRERPLSDGRAGPGEVAADFFQLDGRLDLRLPGLIEGRAIRLEFTGQTPVLRTFLQSLADSPEPLLVRSVDVEPLPEGAKQRGHGTKMCVVVELTKPGFSPGQGGHETREPILVATWKNENPPFAPESDSRGYELFDLPSQLGDEREALSSGLGRPRPDENPVIASMVLLAVMREPYRLQLAGYYGAPGDYTVAFISPGSPETLRARAGHRFEALGLVLKSFSLMKCATQNQNSSSGYEITACAKLWDERQQQLVTLLGSERLLTATPLAILRLGPASTRAREFRSGDSFQVGADTWRIESIQLDPAEVVIARLEPGAGATEQRVLRPTDNHKSRVLPDLASADRSK